MFCLKLVFFLKVLVQRCFVHYASLNIFLSVVSVDSPWRVSAPSVGDGKSLNFIIFIAFSSVFTHFTMQVQLFLESSSCSVVRPHIQTGYTHHTHTRNLR